MLTVPSGLTLAAVTLGLPSPSVSLASTAMLLIATIGVLAMSALATGASLTG
jgi:hypothetical protein